VLAVGWPQTIRIGGTRATAIALLAHEVATVIERADMLSRLTDMASTDALTGLPNRRAWETSLQRALSEDKEFNDTQGHPAGDRLLRETAAAWREELRAGDLVARLGGDEFALLLHDCNAANALEVVERLRRRIPSEQTCSAGIATRVPGSPPEALMAQADTALYEAKTAGRNRTCVTA
jgi:PleD family two-component response regulator